MRNQLELQPRIAAQVLLLALGLLAVGCNRADEQPESTEPETAAITAAEPEAGLETPAEEQDDSALFEESVRRFGSDIELISRVPRRALGNQPVTLEATVRNTSQEPVEGLSVTHNTPNSFRRQETQLEGQTLNPKVEPDGLARYEIGRLPPGESRTLKLTGRPAAGAEELAIVFGVDYPMTVSKSVPVQRAKLDVDVTVAANEERQDVFYPCDALSLQYAIENSGNATVRTLRLRTDLPEGVKTKDGRNQITIEAGRLAAGESFREAVEIEVPETAAFQPEVTVESEFGETTVEAAQVRLARPQLEVSIDGPSEHKLGQPLAYEIVVRNVGEVAALDAEVQAPTPEGVAVAEVTGDDVQREGELYQLGRIEPNSQKTFRMTLRTKQAGPLDLKAEANAYCASEPVAEEMTTQLQGVPAMAIELSDLDDPVSVGESTSYELTVRNEGTQPLEDLSLTVKLPSQLAFTGASGASEATLQDGAIQIAKTPTVQPEEELTWTLEVEAKAPGQAFTEVRLRSSALSQAIIEQEPTTVY